MEIFDYDNILLLPRKCRVESRSECDAGVELGGRKFRLPVVPANMKTVEEQKEDVPRDMSSYKDSEGNSYDFAFGLNWSGVIRDERVSKYK